MKNLLLSGLFIFLLCSCGGEQKIPADVLQKEQLLPVLMDVHLLEAMLETETLKGDSLYSYTKSQYQKIWEKHKITEEQYHHTMDFYFKNPPLIDELYQEVIDKLTQMEAGLEL